MQPRRQVTEGRGLLRVRTEVEILNLSLTGAAIATVHRLALMRTYRLLLRQGSWRLDVDATVVRSTLRSPRAGAALPEPFYEMGLEFQGVLGETGQEVADFFAGQALPESGGRVCYRFPPPPGLRAEIEREEDFELCSISPAGLAVETAVDVEPGREVAMDVRLDHSGLGFAVAGRIVYRLPVAPDRYRLGIESAPFPPSTPS